MPLAGDSFTPRFVRPPGPANPGAFPGIPVPIGATCVDPSSVCFAECPERKDDLESSNDSPLGLRLVHVPSVWHGRQSRGYPHGHSCSKSDPKF